MNEFAIPATEETVEFFRDIATAMMRLYSIPRSEAVGRITKFWAGQNFSTEYRSRLIQHQGPDQWADLIYYGRKGNWLNEGTVRPVTVFA